MPLYEYICQADGEVIELLRPAAQADDPVDDPKGRGRQFVRMHSTFASRTGASGTPARDVSLGQSHACRCGRGGGCGH